MILDEKSYSVIYEREHGHWWFKGRERVLKSVIERDVNIPPNGTILDVGCGTGGNIEFLSSYGLVSGCDYSDTALEYCKIRGLDNVVKASIYELPYSDNSFNLVTCFDVIEHIPDDFKAFSELARVTDESGYILITLPADPAKYSNFDCFSGHLRRYREREVFDLADFCECSIVRISRYMCFVHPVVIYYMSKNSLDEKWLKKTEGMQTALRGSNRFLLGLCRLESMFLKRFNLSKGTSLFCLFKKSKDAKP